MEELWLISEFEKIAALNPDKVIRLLKKDKELFWEVVVSAYLDRKISLGKAAELLGMTREELIEEFHKRGIPIRKLSKEDVIAEVEALNCL
ncbi:UPF0175 family protein [Thermococcus paralvinellae]|uniref:Uncharacterized protein n=1 Tax=Thermococcus paralvinellae TaxID=582419 RepID=W0IA79_9EURY|nr:UPF0175 family protein [Thermococcus paralvinellae]AHF81390.1 Hypothetical protein TES1_2015 [Thermococcus paralvinellae]